VHHPGSLAGVEHVAMSEFKEGRYRYFAYFLVTDGERGVLEKDPFHKRAYLAFEAARREIYDPALWSFEHGTLQDVRLDLPCNENESDFFDSPRYFAVNVDRGRVDEYRKIIEARAAERCVTVELVVIYSLDRTSNEWAIEPPKPTAR
jgi:hypothetical protein